MNKEKTFSPVRVKSSNELEDILKACIENREISYFLFINSWDKVCQHFNECLNGLSTKGNPTSVYVVDIFDIPNGLNLVRASIRNENETTRSTNWIRNYSPLPMMVRLQGAFPIPVEYNGTIAAELGL